MQQGGENLLSFYRWCDGKRRKSQERGHKFAAPRLSYSCVITQVTHTKGDV
jgi:hypothetical protein